MQTKNKKLLLIKALLTTIIIIYLSFLYLDIFTIGDPPVSNMLKFISIILCFFIGLLIGKDRLSRMDRFLLQLGLFFTVLADLSFLILENYSLGLGLFCLVQIIYYNRYRRGPVHSQPLQSFAFLKFFLIFLIVLASVYLVNLTRVKVDFLYGLGFFYAICLISSTGQALGAFRKKLYPSPNRYLILIGMVLFLLCDTSIALSFAGRLFNLANYSVFALLVWPFYLPSQLLLALSGYGFRRRRGFY